MLQKRFPPHCVLHARANKARVFLGMSVFNVKTGRKEIDTNFIENCHILIKQLTPFFPKKRKMNAEFSQLF